MMDRTIFDQSQFSVKFRDASLHSTAAIITITAPGVRPPRHQRRQLILRPFASPP